MDSRKNPGSYPKMLPSGRDRDVSNPRLAATVNQGNREGRVVKKTCNLATRAVPAPSVKRNPLVSSLPRAERLAQESSSVGRTIVAVQKTGGKSATRTETVERVYANSARAFVQKKRLAMAANECSAKDDSAALPSAMVKAARRSGQLNLSNRGLQFVPDKVWRLNCPDEADQNIMTKGLSMDKIEEDPWWEFAELSKLFLSSNQITCISKDIQLLTALIVLDLHDNAITFLPAEIGKLGNLTTLNLNHNKLSELPMAFYGLKNLKSLTISNNNLKSLDRELCELTALKSLNLSHNQLEELPAEIGYLGEVSDLNLSHNHLKSLPNEFNFMRMLQIVDLSTNKLECTPDSMQDLGKLEQLYLQRNRLTRLPKLNNCHNLKEILAGSNRIEEVSEEDVENISNQLNVLELRENQLQALPTNITHLKNLERLDVSSNNLTDLPAVLGLLSNMKSLLAEGNPIRTIRRDIFRRGTVELMKYLRMKLDPEVLARFNEKEVNISALGGAQRQSLQVPDKFAMKTTKTLNMSKMELTKLPGEAVENAIQANVTGIDLSQNQLTSLPESVGALMPKIVELNISGNKFSGALLDQQLQDAFKLQYLNLSNNRLATLSVDFGKVSNLREVCLSFNKFSTIPAGLFACEQLEILLLNDNKVKEVDVAGLKRLKILTVLDLSNNDIDFVPPELGSLQSINILQLEGNPFRVPTSHILKKGTQSIMSYLRGRTSVDSRKIEETS